MSYPISLFFGISQTYFFYTKEVEVHDSVSGAQEKYRLIIPDCFDFPLIDQLFRKKVVRGFLKQGCTPTLTEKGVVLSLPNNKAKLLELCSRVEGLDDENKVLLNGFAAMLQKGQYGLAEDCIKTLYEISPQASLLEIYAEFLKFKQGSLRTSAFAEKASSHLPTKAGAPVSKVRRAEASQIAFMFMELYRRDNKRTDLLLEAVLADPSNEEASEALEAFARSPSAWMNLYLYIYVRTGSEVFLKKASRIDTKSPLVFLAQISCARNRVERREAYAKLADLYTELGELDQARYYRSKNPSAFFNYVASTTRDRILPKEATGDKERRMPALPKFLRRREKNLEEGEATYESAEIRRGLLEYIDCALKQKEWENPDQVIHGLISSVVAQRKISEGSFYKRCVLVCQDEGRREFYLKRLWEHYTSRNKIDKAAVVYQLSLSNLEFDRHFKMTLFLSENGKFVSAMARTLFSLAQQAIQLNQLEGALQCLSLLERQDQAIFSHHEKILIFLMRSIVDLKVNAQTLQEVQPPSLKMQEPARAVQLVRKRGVVMHLVHPACFYCYVDSHHRYFFTEKSVEVIGCKKRSVMTYPLKLVRPPEMPIETKLSTKDAIGWLLDNGYSPKVIEDSITFVQLTDRDLFQPVIEQCAALCRDRNQRDILQAQLLTAQACLNEELYSVAITYLQKAYETSRNTSDEAQVKKMCDDAQELKLQTFVCLDGAQGVSDPRTEWISRCSSLYAELEGINDELVSSLQVSKFYVELGSYTLAKTFLEVAVQMCLNGPFEERVRELSDSCSQLMTHDSLSNPMASVLEDKPTLSEETFHTLACLSQLPASKKRAREKLFQKLMQCDPQNKGHYQRAMQAVPEQPPQMLLGEEAKAKELLRQYKTSGKLEEARIVAQYLHDQFKNFETSMDFAATLIFDDRVREGLNIYFEVALESVRCYQIADFNKCVAAIREHEDLLDASQKSVLIMLNRFIN